MPHAAGPRAGRKGIAVGWPTHPPSSWWPGRWAALALPACPPARPWWSGGRTPRGGTPAVITGGGCGRRGSRAGSVHACVQEGGGGERWASSGVLQGAAGEEGEQLHLACYGTLVRAQCAAACYQAAGWTAAWGPTSGQKTPPQPPAGLPPGPCSWPPPRRSSRAPAGPRPGPAASRGARAATAA